MLEHKRELESAMNAYDGRYDKVTLKHIYYALIHKFEGPLIIDVARGLKLWASSLFASRQLRRTRLTSQSYYRKSFSHCRAYRGQSDNNIENCIKRQIVRNKPSHIHDHGAI